MPGCSAFGCTNRREKGFKVFKFPADEQIRESWKTKVNRLGWEPSINSVLCEVGQGFILVYMQFYEGILMFLWIINCKMLKECSLVLFHVVINVGNIMCWMRHARVHWSHTTCNVNTVICRCWCFLQYGYL